LKFPRATKEAALGFNLNGGNNLTIRQDRNRLGFLGTAREILISQSYYKAKLTLCFIAYTSIAKNLKSFVGNTKIRPSLKAKLAFSLFIHFSIENSFLFNHS
jgi:hypothetical protein